mmetsp:Transcript_36524/g.94271  ORF Transcript_36524/g.94271 Transcript_36524/m.94271 type:complete len:303 (+) Transcript_36524:1001-1909(+)
MVGLICGFIVTCVSGCAVSTWLSVTGPMVSWMPPVSGIPMPFLPVCGSMIAMCCAPRGVWATLSCSKAFSFSRISSLSLSSSSCDWEFSFWNFSRTLVTESTCSFTLAASFAELVSDCFCDSLIFMSMSSVSFAFCASVCDWVLLLDSLICMSTCISFESFVKESTFDSSASILDPIAVSPVKGFPYKPRAPAWVPMAMSTFVSSAVSMDSSLVVTFSLSSTFPSTFANIMRSCGSSLPPTITGTGPPPCTWALVLVMDVGCCPCCKAFTWACSFMTVISSESLPASWCVRVSILPCKPRRY